MLKRTLTIGILILATLLIVAAGPPANGAGLPPAPADDSTPQSLPNVAYLKTDVAMHAVIWGTSTVDDGIEPPAGPADAPLSGIPQTLLNKLPQHVRQAFATGVTQSNNYQCHAEARNPYKSGSNVKARGSVSCVGTSVLRTRLDIELRRGFTPIATHDSEWKTWKSHSNTVSASCVGGTWVYLNGVIGRAQIDGEDEWYEIDVSDVVTLDNC